MSSSGASMCTRSFWDRRSPHGDLAILVACVTRQSTMRHPDEGMTFAGAGLRKSFPFAPMLWAMYLHFGP